MPPLLLLFLPANRQEDATREMCNKTNSCSQKVRSSLYRRVLPVSCTSFRLFICQLFPLTFCHLLCIFVCRLLFLSQYLLPKIQRKAQTFLSLCDLFDYGCDVETICAAPAGCRVLRAGRDERFSVKGEESPVNIKTEGP